MDPARLSDEGLLRPEWLASGTPFTIPAWDRIEDWVRTFPETEDHERYSALARHWTSRLAEEFGGGCKVYESQNFLAVLPCDLDRARRAVRFYEEKLAQLVAWLGPHALPDRYGKMVFLVPPDLTCFYAYYSCYATDGENIQPGGVYLNRGYGHVLFPSLAEASLAAIVVHELCHALLVHLPLPLWVNEGLTQCAETALGGRLASPDDAKTRADHTAFWTPERIARFWTGASFNEPGDASALSYDLSKLLVGWLRQIDQRAFERVLAGASYRDAGFAAVVAAFGHSPADLLAEFLGDGDWANGHAAAPAIEPD